MPDTVLTIEEHLAAEVLRCGRSSTVTFIPEPEAELLFCPIISVDDHALEPPDLFEGRLPKSLQAAAPHVEAAENGLPLWVIDGFRMPIHMANGASGRVMSEWSHVGIDFDEIRRGAWDSTARLHDMDLTGVWSSLCFGSTTWGFAGTKFSKMSNPELGLACMRAYNDWMIEEWCGASPERYIPCQLPWLRDAHVAASEVYLNAERGFKAVTFSENPEALGFPNVYDLAWDPFFRACEETRTVVNLHVGSSGTVRRPCSSSHVDVNVALFPVLAIEALVDWIYSGVPARFPELKIVLSEGGVSWLSMALERLGRAHRHNVGDEWPGGDLTPRELVSRNFRFTSIEDPSAFRHINEIGADLVMVETDYPHYDSTWPACQDMIRRELGHLPSSVARRICFENAAETYRVPMPPGSLVARSEIGAA